MKRILPALAIILLSACGEAEKKFDTEQYEVAKESLEEKERKNPERFLVLTTSDRKNIIGQKVIKGTIHNRASVCTYKDVQIKISFYSETGVLLEENKETIYKIIPPNNSVAFKSEKYFAPKGTSNVKVTVVGAKTAD
ncbi:MAG TPA: hypothetical protein VF145_11260 [Chitinophagaceae bacterium]